MDTIEFHVTQLFALLSYKTRLSNAEGLTETEWVMHGAISDYLDELETLEN